jgi:hypothetical protein
MLAYWLLAAHLVGDYVLQSDWMATEKTKKSVAALAHVATYVLPFLFVTRSPWALAFIASTHFIIDRWRLARYVCWLKNFLAPRRMMPAEICERHALGVGTPDPELKIPSHQYCVVCKPQRELVNDSWEDCSLTGYLNARPAWLRVWLMFIADNTMHLVCNGIALEVWGTH